MKYNDNLIEFLCDKLLVTKKEFTSEELNLVDDLVIDFYDYEYHITTPMDLNVLVDFHNLESLRLNFVYVSESDNKYFTYLPLKKLVFNNSIVEEISFIDNYLLDTLGIIKSRISDYSFVSKQLHLKKLYLIDITLENLEFLNNLNELEYLSLTSSKIDDISALNSLNNLNTIDLDDSNIIDFSFLKYLSNLKCISISGSQFRNNKSLFKELVYNGVKVTNRHSFIYTKEDFDND